MAVELVLDLTCHICPAVLRTWILPKNYMDKLRKPILRALEVAKSGRGGMSDYEVSRQVGFRKMRGSDA